MRLFTNIVLALSVAISRHHVYRQDDLARRDPGEINLYKRFDNARFTYYDVGLGACGNTNQPSDFVVALDIAQFNGGQFCFQMITITIGPLTTQAQIVDECPGCPPNGLDFSSGLFQFFGPLGNGVLTGTWNFGSGSPPPSPSPSPSPPPPPPTTSADIPTTTWIPPPTTTSQPPPMTTSAPSTSSSSSTIVSSNSTSSVPTQTTTNTVTETPGANSSVLFEVNLSILDIGQFLSACRGW
ncbi:RlpA-like double-psi beta-barrel-protein domain-containing protein-containing protein [Boletus edulis BED1]|uniref:RlpA-like double-psi beta-barrel-protein domain-containing protein-containing protein n=1 Tax=Boletus edulis BED1 TaxID=1328754 RepID=A0AAD4C456_BOLED|nr:RlpA-like double-psi beta-barrel-protein domain-containing protein-containing protein [Boletus edulis BED1]